MENKITPPQATPTDNSGLSIDYLVISSPSDTLPYQKAIKEAPLLAIDTETTGLDPHRDRLRLIQISAPGIPVLVFDCAVFLPDGISCLRELLDTPSEKLFHNAKFDLQFLMGIGIECYPVFDTMLAAQLLRPCGGPLRAGLAAVADHYLGIRMDKTEQTGLWDSTSLTGSQLAYAALDAGILLKLYGVMKPLLAHHVSTGLPPLSLPALPPSPIQNMTESISIWNRWDSLRRKTRSNITMLWRPSTPTAALPRTS